MFYDEMTMGDENEEKWVAKGAVANLQWSIRERRVTSWTRRQFTAVLIIY